MKPDPTLFYIVLGGACWFTGFWMGYLLRAAISWRRRRQSYRGWY